MRKNIIVENSFQFAVKMLRLYKLLINNGEYVISRQLLRCSTSIGANVFEATAAVSRKDFINKMAIASKEARETYFWLRLVQEGELVNLEVEEYIDDVNELIRILTAIVKTSSGKLTALK